MTDMAIYLNGQRIPGSVECMHADRPDPEPMTYLNDPIQARFEIGQNVDHRSDRR